VYLEHVAATVAWSVLAAAYVALLLQIAKQSFEKKKKNVQIIWQ
jgi:hypothetical protein